MSTETKQVDYRTTEAPTDWLAKRVAQYDEYYKDADFSSDEFKTEYDYVKEFIAQLNGQRCQPVCANGHGARNGQGSGKTLTNGLPSANGLPTVDCICSLLEQMTATQAPLVPKGEFVAVVQTAGYSQEQALKHYRDYAWTKINDRHMPDISRLMKEGNNAHNWWLELSSWEASSQASAAEEEIMAIDNKIEKELEAIMSA